MNTSTKRTASVGVSIGAVAAVVLGSFAFAANLDRAEVEPAPTIVATTPAYPEPVAPEEIAVESDDLDAAAARIAEEERLAAEAARVAEEARLAAEAEAARVAAEEAARQAQSVTEQNTQDGEQTDNRAAAPENNPAPAPAPAPLKTCPAGTTPVEFDGAGNAVGCMDPACFTGEVQGTDPRCAVVRP